MVKKFLIGHNLIFSQSCFIRAYVRLSFQKDSEQSLQNACPE